MCHRNETTGKNVFWKGQWIDQASSLTYFSLNVRNLFLIIFRLVNMCIFFSFIKKAVPLRAELSNIWRKRTPVHRQARYKILLKIFCRQNCWKKYLYLLNTSVTLTSSVREHGIYSYIWPLANWPRLWRASNHISVLMKRAGFLITLLSARFLCQPKSLAV